MSGRPPPPPPATAATCLIDCPACTRDVRSFVTIARKLGRSSTTAPSTTTAAAEPLAHQVAHLPHRVDAVAAATRAITTDAPSTRSAACNSVSTSDRPAARSNCCARFRSASSSASSASTRCSSSEGVALSLRARACRSSPVVPARTSSASSPVSASMRRSPDPTLALARDDERPDLPGAMHVRAAAQLLREAMRVRTRIPMHAPPRLLWETGLAVRAPSEVRRSPQPALAACTSPRTAPCAARGDGLVVRHVLPVDIDVLADLLVDETLHGGELFRLRRLDVREVEPQPVGRDERARLTHVVAEHLAQRRVQQVRRRVVALDRAPLRRHRQRPCTTSLTAMRPSIDATRGARSGLRRATACRRLRSRPFGPTISPVSPTWPPPSG